MGTIWGDGDQIQKRCFSKEAWKGREYVFEVIRRDPGSFLEMKRIQYQDHWNVYYRTEGACTFQSFLEQEEYRGELIISRYLKLMYGVLEAVDEAEEQMIMSGSFEINEETIWYHTRQNCVKIMYVPRMIMPESREITDQMNSGIWTKRSSPEILKDLLERVGAVDRKFRLRWPELKTTLEHWERTGAGRKFCMRELRSWLREFPE